MKRHLCLQLHDAAAQRRELRGSCAAVDVFDRLPWTDRCEEGFPISVQAVSPTPFHPRLKLHSREFCRLWGTACDGACTTTYIAADHSDAVGLLTHPPSSFVSVQKMNSCRAGDAAAVPDATMACCSVAVGGPVLASPQRHTATQQPIASFGADGVCQCGDVCQALAGNTAVRCSGQRAQSLLCRYVSVTVTAFT